jgi:DNA-binding MarR family transcriptional regulator
MSESKANAEALRDLREQHIGRLLLQAQRAFNQVAIAKLQQRGYAGLSLAHTALLPHLDLEGTRITTLAERAGITKQGMGQLVTDLERQGLVSRAQDPADGRASLVTFTEAGWAYLQAAHEVKREMEAEYAALLGEEKFAELRLLLHKVIDSVE